MCTYVSAFAFYSCSNLSSISLPACEIIGKQALIGTALSVLVLPVTSLLGSYALEGLTSLYLLSSEMCDYQAPSLFNDDELSTTIYVPASLYSEYLNASKWVYYWENGATLASI